MPPYHINAFARKYGPPAPCPAFLFGVVVAPGIDWFESGFDLQNTQLLNQEPRLVLGRTVQPSHSTLREWAEYIPESFFHGQTPLGGWAPGRSHEVRWGAEGSDRSAPTTMYYKSFDHGANDLMFWPLKEPAAAQEDMEDGIKLARLCFQQYADYVEQHGARSSATIATTTEQRLALRRHVKSWLAAELAGFQSSIEAGRRSLHHFWALIGDATVQGKDFSEFEALPAHLVLDDAGELILRRELRRQTGEDVEEPADEEQEDGGLSSAAAAARSSSSGGREASGRVFWKRRRSGP